MSLWKRDSKYWTDFTVDGVRYRKPLGTTDGRLARVRERELIAAAQIGKVNSRAPVQKRLFEAIDAYLADKKIRCAERTIELEGERLSLVKQHFGDIRLSSITPGRFANYQHVRNKAGTGNRTINMDLGALSRVLKFCDRWRALAGQVKPLPEPPSLIGRALTPEEQKRLFEAAKSNPEWEHVYCAAVVAANTSLRPVEVKHLRRMDVDLFKKTLTVRRSKNVTSHRVIPLNESAHRALLRMVERADQLGHQSPEHFLWAACRWHRIDPSQPIKKWDTAWRALRKAATLPGLRFHDLRHTVITELAELNVPDRVLESISGHLSKRMLDHYSHIRLEAKRQALEALDAKRASTKDGEPAAPDGAIQ